MLTLQASNEVSLDKIAAACPATDYNVVANKQQIILTSDFGLSGGNFPAALDGNATANGWWIPRYQDITNKTVLKFQFPSPTIVTGFEHTGNNGFLRGNAEYKIQGSNDDVNWVDVTGVQAAAGTKTAPVYGAPENTIKYPIAGNTGAYLYYRVYGVSYQTWYDWVDEFYFETQPPTSGLTNVSCNDATTLYSTTDDYITFDLNPNTSTSGTYSIIASGATVTPSIANFGSSTSFRLQDGSAGSGNVTLTIIDNALGCDLTETITDPGTCLCPSDSDSDGICDTDDLDDDNDGIPDVVENAICNIDYNLTANKQFIEISTTASIGGSSSGNPRVLLDGNLTATNYYYNGTGITDKELVRLKFPKPTILTGLEYYIGNSFMLANGAVTIIQASNDGNTWTDVSPQFVKASPNNTPGVLSAAPFAQTFLWNNTTSYTYYRLYGISGNANQNPWVYELYFRIDSSICDLDKDGVANSLDLDSDNDGIPDNVEGQPTLTYVAPNNDTPAQYLANNGINSAYGTGLVPPNFDGDFCEDFIDIDTDNDGTEDKDESGLALTGTVGSNGFDNGLESADDYSDANGNINDPKNDLSGSDPGNAEVFYRQIPTPGGVYTSTSLVNGVAFTFYDGYNADIENGIAGTVRSTGYIGNFVNADDIFTSEDGTTFMLKLEAQIEITTGGNYSFQITSLDDVGAIFINGSLHSVGTAIGTPINLTAGMHTIEARFGENSGGEAFNVGYSGPDNGNVMGNIPDNKLWTTPSISSWHKANQGVTGADGATPTLWGDFSGNGNNLTQSGNPIYHTTNADHLFNYNPSIYFTDDFFQSADNINGFAYGTQGRTSFLINVGTGTGTEVITGYGNGTTNQVYQLYSYQQRFHIGFWGNDAAATEVDYTLGTVPNLSSAKVLNYNIEPGNNVIGAVNVISRVDARKTGFNTRLSGGNDFRIGSSPGQSSANAFFNNISEVIHYPWVLSPLEQLKVESYLAIKYGITLDTTYVASNGNPIWTSGEGYDNDIAGIGKDIASGLAQKQGQSQSGKYFTMSLGSLVATNIANTSSFAADKSFNVWGHNGAALDFATPLVGDHKYATRLWKIKETGTVDSVEISLHISDMRGTAPMLVRSTDATIEASDDQVLLTLVGDYYTGKIDFSDGDYFTFAQEPPPSPGGVSFGLELWTLPTSITYDAANDNIITKVEDFSGNIAADQTYGIFDYISSDPKIIEGGINFNPNIEFDGNDWLRKQGGFNTNTWTAGERFTVLAESEAGYNGNNGFVTDFAAVAGGAHYTYGNKSIYHRFGSSDRHSWNSTTGANVESDGTHQGYLFDTRDYLIDNVWSDTNDWGNDINENPTYRDVTNTPNFTMPIKS